MADRVITAEAVIRARDDGASDILAKIAGKVDAIGKAAKHSAEVQKLGKALGDMDRQAQAVNGMVTAQDRLDRMKVRAAETAANVDKLGKQMSAVEKPTAAMVKAMAAAEAAAKTATSSVLKQAEAVKKAEGALAAFGHPADQAVAVQERLRNEMDRTTAAIERQMTIERRAAEATKASALADREHAWAQQRVHDIAHRNGAGHLVSNAAAAYVSAHGVVSAAEKAYEAGAEYQHEIVGLQNAGRTMHEIREITEAAAAAARAVPTSTYIDNLKVIAETTTAFGSVEHAIEHLQFVQKASSVLKASGGEHVQGGPGDIGRALAKTFEERMTKPEDFEKEANSMIPAMVASGGTFNPEQLYAFAQQAKTALQNYDIHYLSHIAPSLITMFGGDRAGTAANAFNSVIMGKVNDKKQAEAWLKAGLLDPSKVIMKAGHVVGWSAGAVKNTDLALRDPLAWAEQVEYPALRDKMNVDMGDRLAVAKQLGTMYRNTNANLWATEHLQEASRHRLHKDSALIDKVGNTDDIYQRNMHNDPTVALSGLTAAFQNLMTTVTAEGMKPAAEAITYVAGTLGHLADVAKEHPKTALGIGSAAFVGGLGISGWATARLLGGGFGLRGSAHALDGSALALKEAAGALATEGRSAGAAGGPQAPGQPGGSKSSLFMDAANALVLHDLAKTAAEHHMLEAPKSLDARGMLDFLDPRLGGLLLGPQADAATADRDARLRKTERQRLMREPLEGGLDRMRAEMTGENAPLPPERPALGRPTMVPADAADRAKDRADAIEKLNDDFGLTGFVMGRLNDKTGVVLTSFDTLGTHSGTLGGSLGELALAAGLAAGKLNALANFGGGGASDGSGDAPGLGSGGGIVKASFGGSSFGGGGAGIARTRTGAPRGGGTGSGPNPYAGGEPGGTFVPPVGANLPAGMRQNNMGNIGYFGQRMAGLIGPSNAHDVDHSIAKFATQEDGIRAAAALALAKFHKGRHTTWDIIAAAGGWTPGKLGPGASVNVARAMGVGNRDAINLDDEGQLVRFLHGLAVQEHGNAGRFYSEDRIRSALHHKVFGAEHPALRATPHRPPPPPVTRPSVTTAQLEGQAHVRVEIVAKDHHVAGTYVGSRGHIRGSVGTTMA